MTTSITLRGSVEYHERFPPANAKKGYVARIKGKAPGALKYEREFLGSEFTAVDAADAGLYEVQTGLKKGGFDRAHYLILPHPEHGLIRSKALPDDAVTRLAKLLDDHVPLADATEVTELYLPERSDHYRFTAVIRTKAGAQKAAAAAETDDATATIRAAIAGMPPAAAAKLLRAIAKELTTPAATATPNAPEPVAEKTA